MPKTEDKPQKVGEAGPKSALETAPKTVKAAENEHAQNYDVQLHTADKGLEVKRVRASSGDEAAQKVLAAEGYKEASIRGVTPASDPDPNSLGGEREAKIMIDNATEGPAAVNPLGTDANVTATKELGKADVTELKD